MADYVFNVSKGRVVEFYNNVETNDPADAKFLLVPLSASGTEAQGQDFDTLAAVIGDANFTRAGGSWGDKTLTDTELAAFPSADDTNNRYDVALPQVTWTAPTAGQNTTGLLTCYTEVATPADADWIPMTHHDLIVTADGNDVVLNAGAFFRAASAA